MCNRVLLLFGKLPQWNLHVNCHVNGTTFQSGLRFQTGSSSLWVSCKRAVSSGLFSTRVPTSTLVNYKMIKNQKKLFLLMTSLNRKSYERFFLAKDFYCLKIRLYVFWLALNRQLLLIKIFAGISNILETVHHLLKLRAPNKGIKQMLFLLVLKLP